MYIPVRIGSKDLTWFLRAILEVFVYIMNIFLKVLTFWSYSGISGAFGIPYFIVKIEVLGLKSGFRF